MSEKKKMRTVSSVPSALGNKYAIGFTHDTIYFTNDLMGTKKLYAIPEIVKERILVAARRDVIPLLEQVLIEECNHSYATEPNIWRLAEPENPVILN